MADNLSEFRAALLRAIERQDASLLARRAMDLPLQAVAATNAFGGSLEGGVDGAFTTGYDSGTGETTVPFTWGISLWGSGDLWTGS